MTSRMSSISVSVPSTPPAVNTAAELIEPTDSKVQTLLDKSAHYSSVIGALLSNEVPEASVPVKGGRFKKVKKSVKEDKRKFEEMEASKVESVQQQSKLITGGTLKDYQLRGENLQCYRIELRKLTS